MFSQFNLIRAACVSTLLITLTVLAGFAVSTGMYLRENAALREQQRLRQVAEATRAAAEKQHVETYLQAHSAEFSRAEEFSKDVQFLPVVERALAIILAREALGRSDLTKNQPN